MATSEIWAISADGETAASSRAAAEFSELKFKMDSLTDLVPGKGDRTELCFDDFHVGSLAEETEQVGDEYNLPLKSSKKRTRDFNMNEDNLLVMAWLQTSQDPVQDIDQTHGTYWQRIHDYFHEHKSFESDCNVSSLFHRWGFIHESVNIFRRWYTQVHNKKASGLNEQDKIDQALDMYKANNRDGKAFNLLHCWKMLRHEQKWLDLESETSQSSGKKQKTSEAACPGSCTTGTHESQHCAEVEGPSHTSPRKGRPDGRKKEKERREMSDEACEIKELEGVLSETKEGPIKVSYAVIGSITKNFSQVIGSGAFGVVYLGGLQNGTMVAVKKLSTYNKFTEEKFVEEFSFLERVKHKNIVRLLAYCSHSLGEIVKIKGKNTIAYAQKEFLCFEYVPNGDLYHYIEESIHGCEWNMRYQIIKGICQGLDYLHKKGIYHLDLKPANVLLGAQMEPKLTDFGVSRFNEENVSTIIVSKPYGTLGFTAPELIDSNTISCKSDIFSLGVTMIRILTWTNKIHDENWHMLESLDGDCKLLKKCIEIAQICCDLDPTKRPTIHEIIHCLHETETMIQMILPVINSDPTNDPKSSMYQRIFCSRVQ